MPVGGENDVIKKLRKVGYIDVGTSKAKQCNIREGYTISNETKKKYIVDTEHKSFR